MILKMKINKKNKGILFIVGLFLLIIFMKQKLIETQPQGIIRIPVGLGESIFSLEEIENTVIVSKSQLLMGQAECDALERICGASTPEFTCAYNQYFKTCTDNGDGTCTCTVITCGSTGYCDDYILGGAVCSYCNVYDDTCADYQEYGAYGYLDNCDYSTSYEECVCNFHECPGGCSGGNCITDCSSPTADNGEYNCNLGYVYECDWNDVNANSNGWAGRYQCGHTGETGDCEYGNNNPQSVSSASDMCETGDIPDQPCSSPTADDGLFYCESSVDEIRQCDDGTWYFYKDCEDYGTGWKCVNENPSSNIGSLCKAPLTCSDSDNGQNGNVKGTVTTDSSQGCENGCTDYCSTTGNRVVEFWCSSSTTKGDAVFIDCGIGGCSDGKCLSSQTCSQLGGTCKSNDCDQYNDCSPLGGSCTSGICCQGTCTTTPETCTDSDGGGVNEKLTKGTVVSSIDGTKTDYCLSASGLREYNCKADKTIGNQDYQCSCTDGECAGTCTCGTWSICSSGKQTRTCTPSGCDIESRTCGIPPPNGEPECTKDSDCTAFISKCNKTKQECEINMGSIILIFALVFAAKAMGGS